ncbi:MAG: hypothetical protein Q8P63_03045 [Candidatus Nealsonbacteria bacterium]|nr:hypothetical protein [Candidatus Nealsonbacteria bacterium]
MKKHIMIFMVLVLVAGFSGWQWRQGEVYKLDTALRSNQVVLADASIKLGVTQNRLGAAEADLQSTKSELSLTTAEFRNTRGELEITRVEIEATKAKLQSTQIELGDTQVKLEGARTELFSQNLKIEALGSQLTNLKDQLTEMADRLEIEKTANEELVSQNSFIRKGSEILERMWRLRSSPANNVIAGLEDLLIAGVVEEASVKVKPVVFYSNDVPAEISAEEKRAIERSLKIVQQYFIGQVGKTFAFSEPVAIQGKRSVSGYASISSETVVNEVLLGLPSLPVKTYYLVFARDWDMSDGTSRAPFFRGAIIGKRATDSILNGNGDFSLNYQAMGILAHELGHVFAGLPDTVTSEPSIMGSKDGIYWVWNFPLVNFLPAEKNSLINFM